jgi:riboflavin synthase
LSANASDRRSGATPLELNLPVGSGIMTLMFSGIVEEMGEVGRIDRSPSSATLSVLAKKVLDDLSVGESIAVNGVCLTVASRGRDDFTAEVSPETLRVTNLGVLKTGDGVNLERPLRMTDRIGGHLVSGHVDGLGSIRERRIEGNATVLSIETAREILRYCILKGSIAVDGVSLTINALIDRGFAVSIIPHTAKATTLGIKGLGASVNLENDLIARYIERFLDPGNAPKPS